jgi:hypothetical protein
MRTWDTQHGSEHEAEQNSETSEEGTADFEVSVTRTYGRDNCKRNQDASIREERPRRSAAASKRGHHNESDDTYRNHQLKTRFDAESLQHGYHYTKGTVGIK